MVTPYLINENPLTVLPSLAKLLGLPKSIIVQQLHYLLTFPKNGKEIDGTKYIYKTYEEWVSDYFSFWTVASFKKHMLGLESSGYVIAIQPEKHKYDRTKYYTLNYKLLREEWEESRA